MAGDVKIRIVRAAARTTTGTQDFTVSGFGTPKAALFIVTYGLTDGTVANSATLAFGATDGTRSWSSQLLSNHNSANTATRRALLDIPIHMQFLGTADARAAFSAWVTDGVQLNWVDPPNGAYLVTVILFGGADLSAYAAVLDVPDANAIDVTAPGFEPDVVLGACAAKTMALNSTNDLENSIGVAHNDGAGTVVQRALFLNEPTNAADGDPRARLDTSSIGGKYSSGAVSWEAVLSAFDSSGFTLTPSASGAGDDFGYLALKFTGCQSWVGSVNAPTGTGNAANTSPGFTPQFVLLGMSMLTAENSDAVDATAGALGLGAFTADEQFSNAVAIEDASATTDTQSVSDDQAVNLDAHDGSAAFDATFVSMDANGWTLNFSAADGTTRKWWGLAVEEESVAPPATNRRRRVLICGAPA